MIVLQTKHYPSLSQRTDLCRSLIRDDMGLASRGAENVCDLLEIIDDRTRQKATLHVNQRPMNHWHEYLGEPTLAHACWMACSRVPIPLELKVDYLRRHRNPDKTEKLTHRDPLCVKTETTKCILTMEANVS